MERREIRTGKNVFFCVIWNRHYKIDVKSWIFCKKILQKCVMKLYIFAVVPLVGTWIEITLKIFLRHSSKVVPLVGTWIEIPEQNTSSCKTASFPLWERGLKFQVTGARISGLCRSPCGNVD